MATQPVVRTSRGRLFPSEACSGKTSSRPAVGLGTVEMKTRTRRTYADERRSNCRISSSTRADHHSFHQIFPQKDDILVAHWTTETSLCSPPANLVPKWIVVAQ